MLKAAVAAAVFAVSPARADAQALELSGGLDASFFNKQAAAAQPAAGRALYGAAALDGGFGEVFTYGFLLEYDPVTDYLFSLGLGFDFGSFDFGLSLFLSSNTWSFDNIDRGIRVDTGFKIPGILFVTFDYATSLNAFVDVPGNRTVGIVNLRLGFWLYNMIASANFERRDLTHTQTMDIEKVFARSKGFARLDIYAKNAPFSLRLDAGAMMCAAKYQNNVNSSNADETLAVFGGLRVSAHPGRHVTWYLEAEVPAGLSGMMSGFFFRAGTGVDITIKPR